MLALKISDTKAFMKKLLVEDTFDTFLASEGSVTTFTTFTFDGTWHEEYFEGEEKALTWRLIKPVIHGIIRGRHTPIQMKIVLKLAGYNVESLLKSSGLMIGPEQVDGLFLNLTFAREEVTVTTGTSMKVFTLDRSVDLAWDAMVRKFLARSGINTLE